MLADRASQSISDNLERLSALQTKAASGKRFSKASDDPGAVRATLGLRSSMQSTQAYLETATGSGDWLSAAEVNLGELVDLATQAVNLALEGVSDTQDAARPFLAGEMDELLGQAIQIANGTHAGNYLFAGYQTQTKPFALVAGSPDVVGYNGDAGLIQRNIGPGQSVTVNVDGDATFSPLFAAIIESRDALAGGVASAIQTSVTHLQTALSQVAEARSLVGARQRQVTASIQRLQDAHNSLAGLLSQKEDANLAEVITELRHQETVFQSALEVGNRTLATLNLFDLMR
jgi:flagellar hook-associated protein 3 FlgL